MPNKSFLLYAQPSNLQFSKTYDTEFDEIIKTFTDQNGRPKLICHCLLIKRNDLLFYISKNMKICQRI